MRFLVDADLPRETVDALSRHGHEGLDVRDIGLGSADDVAIAQHALTERLGILTGDFGFADIRRYPPDRYHGTIVLVFPNRWTAAINRLAHRIIRAAARRDRSLARTAGHR